MLSDKNLFLAFYSLVLLIPVLLYVRWQLRKERLAHAAMKAGELFTEGPRGHHPHIDTTNCIGCQGCTTACPEGEVLGMVGGKAALIKPYRCIGHGLCAEACPVGAIVMVKSSPTLSANLPYLTPELETSVSNLFIAGELSGLALIKNAINQGRDRVDAIARNLETAPPAPEGVLDVVIVGAGPAGISASLRSIERNLNYLTIERETIGGTVAKYPRQKLVMTSPVALPLHPPLKKMQLSKEDLLAYWTTVCNRPDLRVKVNEPVEAIRRQADGSFSITTPHGQYQSRAVLLAIGKNGTPRKLGVKGEDLEKVMYRLLEADHYINKKIMVVGGGDSAVEAAIGLAMQKGNEVILSYRKESFSRIKERNVVRLESAVKSGKLQVILNSIPVEFRPESVLLDVAGTVREVPNDYVWIFAGGISPDEFLKKIGIKFGPHDLTREAAREAALAADAVVMA